MNKTNQLFSGLLVFLFAQSIVLAFVNGTYLEAFLIGLPAMAVPLYLIQSLPDQSLTRHAIAVASMIFACLHIHQLNGLIEVHFEIFILMAFLIIFSDWKIFISAITLIAVHHLSFYFMQVNGVGVYVFDQDRLMFSTVIIHAVYAGAEAIIAGYIAHTMYKDSYVGQELFNATKTLTENEQQIDMKIRTRCENNEVLVQFNHMLDLLDKVVESVKVDSKQLANNANTLCSTQGELEASSASKEGETNVIATASEQMAVTVSSISSDASDLSDKMNQATQATDQTNGHVSDINVKTTSLTQALNKTSDEVNELANNSSVITSVLQEITSIADQTNLLALNAAIEAARAGEQGRGFAVVADEVRALANRTKESTDKISETLEMLMTSSNNSTQAMEKCVEEVALITEVTQKAKAQIEEATQLVNQSNDIATGVAAAVEQQSATTSDIARSAEALRRTVSEDVVKVKLLSGEAEAIRHAARDMELSIASFK